MKSPSGSPQKHPLAQSKSANTNPIDFRFSLDFFQRIPDAPGLFWMQDSRRQILFVGATEKLRSELLYFKNMRWTEATDDIKELCQKVKQIDWNSTPTLHRAQEMKNALVRQAQPPFNKKAKTATPLYIEIYALTPKRIQLHWGDAKQRQTSPEKSQVFGPFYGKNTLHRTYSALLRWIWIVGSSQPPHLIPPYLLKPLLKNELEIPIDQLFFENQQWISSLTRFLKGCSDLFLDYGLRRMEKMPESQQSSIQRELFAEDLVFLDRFFKRYSNVNLQITGPAPQ